MPLDGSGSTSAPRSRASTGFVGTRTRRSPRARSGGFGVEAGAGYTRVPRIALRTPVGEVKFMSNMVFVRTRPE